MSRERPRQPSPTLIYLCIILPTLLLYWFTGIKAGSLPVILAVPALMLLFGAICIIWSVYLRARAQRPPTPRCTACQYDLAGLPSRRAGRIVCPECGRPNEPTA